ncbi:hypothetical protein [Saccharothrix deserti]|uniref:hypothetical protein n=1 Tax=Saccharothrix deserti TaxID=2593674 RepID=UPI00131CD2A4|nr:hypothetical protein [Saccharothrix deserti]
MSNTRIAALLVAALTLSACGQTDTPTDKPAVAQGGSEFAEAGEKSAGFGTDAEPGQFPRTIKHAMGETVIEKRPERVVVLDGGELDNVVALGIKPVGVAFPDGAPTMPTYGGGRRAGPDPAPHRTKTRPHRTGPTARTAPEPAAKRAGSSATPGRKSSG